MYLTTSKVQPLDRQQECLSTNKTLQCGSHVELPNPSPSPDFKRMSRTSNRWDVAAAFSGRALAPYACPRASMNCIFVKLRWLFWNVWLHTTALKASLILACVCVECEQRCVLPFAAWLIFLRQNKYTGTVVCAAFLRDRREQSKVLFFHLHWNDYSLFICIRPRKEVNFWSADFISQISRLFSSPFICQRICMHM